MQISETFVIAGANKKAVTPTVTASDTHRILSTLIGSSHFMTASEILGLPHYDFFI